MIAQQQETTCYLQFHHIGSFPHVVHGIFTRQGGYSLPPYRGLNTLGSIRGGDNLDTVIQNRQLALHSLGLDDYPCITLWNIHGADVYIPDLSGNWRTDWANRSYYDYIWLPEQIHKGDALITNQRGIALALSFADCVPIVFYDPVQQVVGIAHGGWRGTARGVVMATVDAMHERFGSELRNILAGIGPAIGPCCYEVSEQVHNLFLGRQEFEDMPTQAQYRDAVHESATFTVHHLPDRDSLRLDLWETNRKQLLIAGLIPEHIEVSDICTSCNVDKFFSHRAEHGKTGRFPVIVALR